MKADNTSAHLDGICDKCFGWVGEPDTETDEMMSCTACFGMARRAQPSELVAEVRRLTADNARMRSAVAEYITAKSAMDPTVGGDAAWEAACRRGRAAFNALRALAAEVSK